VLIGFGLATATAERVVAGGRTVEVARVRRTEAEAAGVVDGKGFNAHRAD
jgi:hypothetical protein